jgi:uncharacterized protein (TIGR02996 family)
VTSADERALLAAITADPAADTARLVYADWLDEHDRPARAEFIRTQVEAGRHHPDSARRAEFDARARALLAEHWVSWWAPVCEAVGLPVPKRPRASRLGRLVGAVWPAAPEGWVPPHGGVRCSRSED